MLVKDNSLTIHQKNLQLLAIEIFKVKMNISPEIMNEIFEFLKNSFYKLRCSNCLSRSTILHILRSIPLQTLPLKYGMKYLTKSKEQAPFFFTVKLKNGLPQGCLCRFCKTYVGQVDFI